MNNFSQTIQRMGNLELVDMGVHFGGLGWKMATNHFPSIFQTYQWRHWVGHLGLVDMGVHFGGLGWKMATNHFPSIFLTYQKKEISIPSPFFHTLFSILTRFPPNLTYSHTLVLIQKAKKKTNGNKKKKNCDFGSLIVTIYNLGSTNWTLTHNWETNIINPRTGT